MRPVPARAKAVTWEEAQAHVRMIRRDLPALLRVIHLSVVATPPIAPGVAPTIPTVQVDTTA
jgi:hypothetical protein